MKKYTLVLMAVLLFGACGGESKNTNLTNANVVVNACATQDTEIQNLKNDIAEKDKKITWLRKKAKDAGADLTK